MQLIAIVLLVTLSFVAGMIALLAYMIWRLMRNAGWDDSNLTNALRLLSHVVLHPHDFPQMYYLPDSALFLLERYNYLPDRDLKRPFWYVELDEHEGVVHSRPMKGNQL